MYVNRTPLIKYPQGESDTTPVNTAAMPNTNKKR
jgi:hypothetical protein